MIKLPQLPADKANHVVYGVVVGLIGAAVAWRVGFIAPATAAVVLAAVIGAAKEAADHFGAGQSSAGDFAATVAGGVAVALATILARAGAP